MRNLEGVRVTVWSAPAAGGELAGVEKTLERLGCRLAAARTSAEVERMLTAKGVDLIVARVTSGFREPLEFLKRRSQGLPPVLVVTTGNEVELYLEAMRAGAFDAVGLPLDEQELMRITTCALEEMHAPMAK